MATRLTSKTVAPQLASSVSFASGAVTQQQFRARPRGLRGVVRDAEASRNQPTLKTVDNAPSRAGITGM